MVCDGVLPVRCRLLVTSPVTSPTPWTDETPGEGIYDT